MSFQVSSTIDPNKIFLVSKSDIEARLDPKMVKYQKKVRQFVYETKSLSQCLISQPQYGANEAGIERCSVDKPRYIRITDINEYGNLKDEMGKTAKVVAPQYMLENNDLLLARSGATVGKAYIHKENEISYPCFFAGYMIRFRVSSEIVSPDFVFIYTQLETYKEWVIAIQRAAGQPNINAEEYKMLKIPAPPKEVQADIVVKMDAAYAAKKQKEAEAQALLDSIDGYLLDELGIELPKQEENTIQSRIFTRTLSEVSDNRFDPDYYRKHYYILIEALVSGIFECVAMKDATSLISSGNTPAKSEYSDEPTDYPIIKVASYKGEFISLEKLGYSKSSKQLKAERNDIFVLSAAHQASYVGRFLKFLNCDPIENTSYVGELICIRAEETICNPMYLFSLLNTEPYKVLLNREKRGQTSHIYSRDIKHIKVPLPPLEKQNEIANHIDEVRQQAKQLKHEAQVGLKQAKKEVEAIILGESV